jgi:cell division protein FtsI (penicillin-binding protein 3)
MARKQIQGAGMDARSVRWIRLRVLMLASAFAPIFAGLLYRAVQLQVIENHKLQGMARDQYERQIELPGRRGGIFDRRGGALAASVDVDSIWANPSEIPDQAKAARQLAEILKLDAHKLQATLEGARQFAWIKRHATPQEVAAVKASGLPGISFVREPRRFYPQRELAAHVLGFSGLDGNGLEGIELALDEQLRGRPQAIAGVRDARGRVGLVDGAVRVEELAGASVTLTLDNAIQYATEKSLQAAVTKAEAVAGCAVVLDPTTGELLALANVPTFNPNDPGRYHKKALRNRAVTDQFEPGSTFKLFTVAGALEDGAVHPNDTFDLERGAYHIGKHTIHDHGGHGAMDVGGIIQVSSNVGAAKIAEKLGRERLQAYHHAFGFGERPGTGLPGEAKGALPFPRAEIALATQSFGQGVTATAIQIAAAVGAIANGGVLMRPMLVSKAVDADGRVLLEHKPETVRRVISESTSREVLSMMKRVVEPGGTATLAHMDEYEVAGKTGTAQKADPATGGYSVDKRTASFVGVVPADRPRLVILVVIDEPKTDVYGGHVAAPAFKEIATVALAHLGVPPSPGAKAKAIASASQPADKNAEANHSKLAAAFAMAAVQPSLPAIPTDDTAEDEDEPVPEGSARVPDVQGLSARAAVRTLVAAGFDPSLLGSGKAIGQTPPAGTSVRKGTQVAVRLESRL